MIKGPACGGSPACRVDRTKKCIVAHDACVISTRRSKPGVWGIVGSKRSYLDDDLDEAQQGYAEVEQVVAVAEVADGSQQSQLDDNLHGEQRRKRLIELKIKQESAPTNTTISDVNA